jgi:hypothetical protein
MEDLGEGRDIKNFWGCIFYKRKRIYISILNLCKYILHVFLVAQGYYRIGGGLFIDMGIGINNIIRI